MLLSGIDQTVFALQVAHSVQDVAHALGLDSGKFFYVVQNCDNGSYYKSFPIPKKTGGVRLIEQPVRGLALAQARLLPVLHHKYSANSYVKGFVKGQSFLSNAKYHERQRWVLNLDIEDFFGTISFGRIRGLFMSPIFSFNTRVATILARICTYKGHLPQGAVTSPVLANLIAKNLDKRLIAIATESKLRYTRYADDLTFSSSHKVIPKSLVSSIGTTGETRSVTLGEKLLANFHLAGFQVNTSKTRIQFRNERQEVTGLVVNETANIRRKDISKLRMKLHSGVTFGTESAAKIWLGQKADASAYVAHIEGWLAYVRQVRGSDDPVLAKLCKTAIAGKITNIKWIQEKAEMVREFDVFLSHASEDKPKIRMLKDALEEVDVKVFFDETSISWGDSLVEKLNIGLLKSTFFIPFLTQRFSEKGWTNKELNSAITHNLNQKGRILPIKDAAFDIGETYPLLNETLYKIWPNDKESEPTFILGVRDEILALVEKEKLKEKA